MDTTDAEIIGKVLAGDRDRFHELVQRHSAPLWGTLRGSLGNLEDAREVLQETWLRAFQRLGTLRDPGKLRAWLLSIALNLVRQHLRRARARQEPFEVLATEEDAGVQPAEAASREELVSALRAGIERLPARQREVVDLRVNHGLSHAEISGLLGISEEASRANTYQALRKLRAGFETLEGEDLS